jgi:tRNA (cmo5U34)-methyltransferase
MIGKTFNESVAYYDDWMKKALPNYQDLFQSAKDVIPFAAGAPIEVLDLGAGTGLFSSHVLERHPQAAFTLVDLADKLLEVARVRFGEAARCRYVVADYRDYDPGQQFDLVISSMSIHHLSDEEKQALFKQVYRLLRPGGAFINVDQVLGESEYTRKLYWEHWLAQVRQREPSEARIQDSVKRRTTYDREATLVDQLAWLKVAGFANVDCVYKNFFVAVFFGSKE